MKLRIDTSGGYVDLDVNTPVKVKKTLNKDDYITVKAISPTALDVPVNSFMFCETSEVGVPTKYTLNSIPKINKLSNSNIEYTFTFEAPMYDLKKSTFRVLDKTDDFFIGTASDFIDLIVSALNDDGYILFKTGTIASTETKTLQFVGDTCWSMLNRVCEAFNLEFAFDQVLSGGAFPVYETVISLSEYVENSRGTTYSQGNGILTISQDQSQATNLVTKLYYEGSTKNLPSNYPTPRLQGTVPFITNNTGLYGTKAAVKYFDDVFPTYTGTIDSVSYDSNGVPSFVDAATPFDINDQLVPNVTANIQMTSGDCAGYTFGISRYDHSPYFKFEIIQYEAQNGLKIPTSTGINIAAGDTYKITEIVLPQAYIDLAIAELDTRAADELVNVSKLPSTFNVQFDPEIIKSDILTSGAFDIGQSITITDPILDIPSGVRMVEVEYDLFFKQNCKAKFTESRFALAGRKEQIANSITQKAAYKNSSFDPIKLQQSQKTTAEIYGQTFESYDGNFKSSKIRVENIDPYHLALDSGEVQFITTADITATETSVSISSGSFIHRNYNVLLREDIELLISGGGSYEPKQEWTITGNSVTVPSATFHYVYIKVDNTKDVSGNLTGTNAELFCSTSLITNKYTTDNYLYYLVGTLSVDNVLSLIWGVSGGIGSSFWQLVSNGQEYKLPTQYATIEGQTGQTTFGTKYTSILDAVNNWKTVATLDGSNYVDALSFRYNDVEKVGVSKTGVVTATNILLTGLTDNYIPVKTSTGFANSPVTVVGNKITTTGAISVGNTYFDNCKLRLYDDGTGAITVGFGLQPTDFRFHGYTANDNFNFYPTVNGTTPLFSIIGTGSVNMPIGSEYKIDNTNIIQNQIRSGVTTSAPSEDAVFAALALKGDVVSSGYVPVSAGLNYINSPFIINGTNVGIGTSTASTPFQIKGSSGYVRQSIWSDDSNGGSVLQFGNDSGDNKAGFFKLGSTNTAYAGASSVNLVNVESAPLGLGTSNSIDLYINANGYIGMQNTNPLYTLDVTGIINTSTGYYVNGSPLSLSNLFTGTTGQIIYHNGTDWTTATTGTEGQYLKLVSGIPTWSTIATGGATDLGTLYGFDSITITSSTGTNATVAAATAIQTGVLAKNDFNNFSIAYTHTTSTSNPHSVTLSQLGYTGATNANYYTLPVASSGALGGIKLVFNINGYYLSSDALYLSDNLLNSATPTLTDSIAFYDATWENNRKCTISELLALGGGGGSNWTTDTYGINYQSGNVGINKTSSSVANLDVSGLIRSTNSAGVAIEGQGTSSSHAGVFGNNPNWIGVQGISTGSIGVYGSSSSSIGVYGTSTFGYGGVFDGLGCKATKYYVAALNTAPTSATATGTTGEIRYTSDYIYVCVATNNWKRAALTTW